MKTKRDYELKPLFLERMKKLLEKDIKNLEKCTFIERMGVYFAKIVDEK